MLIPELSETNTVTQSSEIGGMILQNAAGKRTGKIVPVRMEEAVEVEEAHGRMSTNPGAGGEETARRTRRKKDRKHNHTRRMRPPGKLNAGRAATCAQ